VKLHDSWQIICRCRLDQKESATPVPVNIDKKGVKNYRSGAKRPKGEKKSEFNSLNNHRHRK
jgi:hypothetical protein